MNVITHDSIEVAIGLALDAYGVVFETPRTPGESDAAYRPRVAAARIAALGVTTRTVVGRVLTAHEYREQHGAYLRVRAEQEAKAHEIRAELDAVCKRHGVRLVAGGKYASLALEFYAALAGCDPLEVA